jgi:hypothetical protein
VWKTTLSVSISSTNGFSHTVRLVDAKVNNNAKMTKPSEDGVLGYVKSTGDLRDALMKALGPKPKQPISLGAYKDIFASASTWQGKLSKIRDCCPERVRVTFDVESISEK